jgi:hypothetical protein
MINRVEISKHMWLHDKGDTCREKFLNFFEDEERGLVELEKPNPQNNKDSRHTHQPSPLPHRREIDARNPRNDNITEINRDVASGPPAVSLRAQSKLVSHNSVDKILKGAPTRLQKSITQRIRNQSRKVPKNRAVGDL